MAENVQLLDPSRIDANKENPRLIFREDELEALQDSIKEQGILVPLSIFADGRRFTLIDGERRWRCALKLGLPKVPVIVQPKPERLQNIMMMFAIHKARSDWDPLPTAKKLAELSDELEARYGKVPTILALAAAASMPRGEVMRYRRILGLPDRYQKELMSELQKPRSDQVLTVDHVLEAVRGTESLEKKGIIDRREGNRLNDSLVRKFKKKTIKSTVSPRLLPKIARAVDRGDLSKARARQVIERLTADPEYTIEDAYKASAANIDTEHTILQSVQRLIERLQKLVDAEDDLSDGLRNALVQLRQSINQLM